MAADFFSNCPAVRFDPSFRVVVLIFTANFWNRTPPVLSNMASWKMSPPFGFYGKTGKWWIIPASYVSLPEGTVFNNFYIFVY